MSTNPIAPLRDFVTAFGRLLDREADESHILEQGSALLRTLVAQDGWLPAAYAGLHRTLLGGELCVGAGPGHAGA